MEDFVLTTINVLAAKYPWLMTALSMIGFLRVLNKPIFALLRAWANQTETKKDDAALDHVEQSKVYQAITFGLDWLASVKMPAKKPEAQPVVLPVGLLPEKPAQVDEKKVS